MINDTLSLRSTAHNGYQWDEIVKSLFDIYLCGGDHIEDFASLMPCLGQASGSHVPSSDTIGRSIKQLATDNIRYTAKSGNTYTFNTNELLNDLLMKLNMAVGLFKSGQFLDVDFDHQFIPTEKHDATYSHKKAFGYFPGVASVGGVIVHVETRDGNTPVKLCQAEILKTAVFVPAQAWAVHLPIPCRLRLLFERNRGNHRCAQQSVLSACVKLRKCLYGICRTGRLENH